MPFFDLVDFFLTGDDTAEFSLDLSSSSSSSDEEESEEEDSEEDGRDDPSSGGASFFCKNVSSRTDFPDASVDASFSTLPFVENVEDLEDLGDSSLGSMVCSFLELFFVLLILGRVCRSDKLRYIVCVNIS